MKGDPWSEDESTELIRRHANGESLHSIAKAMERGKRTVARYAEKHGLSFDRTATAKATEAVVVDNRTRRADLEARFLAEAEASLDRMWDGMEIGQFAGMDGEYKTAWLTEPSPSDRAKIMQTAAVAVTAANKLGLLNAGKDVDHAKASLTKLRASLQAEAAANE